jgi:K+-transporting ATPase ATPase C chain
MRRELVTSVVAVLVITVLFGLAYPLIVTGVAQVVFPGKADGSQVRRAGDVLGSRLIGQEFRGPRYFHSRPSVTGYDPAATFFNNLGPNQKELRGLLAKNLAAYLELERPYNPGLSAADVPVDAVTTSASGVDPHISEANAGIQARRVASVRRLPAARVHDLIADNTEGRALGFLGEPGVNVLELNLALDREAA